MPVGRAARGFARHATRGGTGPAFGFGAVWRRIGSEGTGGMQLAFITSDERGGADRLLAGFARDLADRGVSLAGVVQSNTERPGAGPCDMDLTLLPDGPVIRISQSLGDGARGCRLDTAALEDLNRSLIGRAAESLLRDELLRGLDRLLKP